MRMNFNRPPILSEEEWKMFDPTIVLNKIVESIEEVRNNNEISEKEIIQTQANLISELNEMLFLTSQNLVWFQEQELTQLIMVLDTAQPSSRVWEKNREFAFEILNYLSLIREMSNQALSATTQLMLLSKKWEHLKAK